MFDQDERQKQWELYLATVSNALCEPMSFNEWAEQVGKGTSKKSAEMTQQNNEIHPDEKRQIYELADRILQGFALPQNKGGEGK